MFRTLYHEASKSSKSTKEFFLHAMQLFAVSRSGGAPRKLTNDGANVFLPQVSPNGRWSTASGGLASNAEGHAGETGSTGCRFPRSLCDS